MRAVDAEERINAGKMILSERVRGTYENGEACAAIIFLPQMGHGFAQINSTSFEFWPCAFCASLRQKF